MNFLRNVAISLVIILCSATVLGAQQRDPNPGCGARQVNAVKNAIITAKTPTDLQYAIDTYWSPSNETECDSWGHRWLSKYAVYAFGLKAKEMWPELSRAQKNAVKDIMCDAVDESTFYLDRKCGINKGNSCSEDYASMVMVIAVVKNQYGRVARRVGLDALDAIEELYIRYTFDDSAGYYGLIYEDDQVKMYNHGGESPVYALYLLTDMGNCMYSYQLANRPAPAYYSHPNMLPLFQWAQSFTAEDGSQFLNTCRKVNGDVIACNDPKVSNTVPKMIPAGRFIGHVGADTGYHFMTWDDSEASGNYDIGREWFYDIANPKPYPRSN